MLFFILIGIGGTGFAPANTLQVQPDGTKRYVNVGASWGAGSLLLVFTLIYGKSTSAGSVEPVIDD